MLRALVHAPPEMVIKTFRLAKAWEQTVLLERMDAATRAKVDLLTPHSGNVRPSQVMDWEFDEQGISGKARAKGKGNGPVRL